MAAIRNRLRARAVVLGAAGTALAAPVLTVPVLAQSSHTYTVNAYWHASDTFEVCAAAARLDITRPTQAAGLALTIVDAQDATVFANGDVKAGDSVILPGSDGSGCARYTVTVNNTTLRMGEVRFTLRPQRTPAPAPLQAAPQQ